MPESKTDAASTHLNPCQKRAQIANIQCGEYPRYQSGWHSFQENPKRSKQAAGAPSHVHCSAQASTRSRLCPRDPNHCTRTSDALHSTHCTHSPHSGLSISALHSPGPRPGRGKLDDIFHFPHPYVSSQQPAGWAQEASPSQVVSRSRGVCSPHFRHLGPSPRFRGFHALADTNPRRDRPRRPNRTHSNALRSLPNALENLAAKGGYARREVNVYPTRTQHRRRARCTLGRQARAH